MLFRSAYLEASKDHRSVFTSMSKQLTEAKYEHYVKGTEKQYRLESKLVDCMQVRIIPPILKISSVQNRADHYHMDDYD